MSGNGSSGCCVAPAERPRASLRLNQDFVDNIREIADSKFRAHVTEALPDLMIYSSYIIGRRPIIKPYLVDQTCNFIRQREPALAQCTDWKLSGHDNLRIESLCFDNTARNNLLLCAKHLSATSLRAGIIG